MPIGKHYEVIIGICEVDNQTGRSDLIDSIGAWGSSGFFDGKQIIKSEWHSTYEKAEEVQKYVHHAAFSDGIMRMKKLPWTCGDCAKNTCDTIKLVELHGEKYLEATCSNCGSQWYSCAENKTPGETNDNSN